MSPHPVSQGPHFVLLRPPGYSFINYIVSLNLPKFATTLANVTPIFVTTSLVVNTKKARFSFDRSSDLFGLLTATISQHHATWEHAPVQSIHIP